MTPGIDAGSSDPSEASDPSGPSVWIRTCWPCETVRSAPPIAPRRQNPSSSMSRAMSPISSAWPAKAIDGAVPEPSDESASLRGAPLYVATACRRRRSRPRRRTRSRDRSRPVDTASRSRRDSPCRAVRRGIPADDRPCSVLVIKRYQRPEDRCEDPTTGERVRRAERARPTGRNVASAVPSLVPAGPLARKPNG